jgi:hypothetical protein
MEDAQTPYEIRCEILEYLLSYMKDDEDWTEFISHNDMGLPLASFVVMEVIESTDKVEAHINQTWDNLMDHMEISDSGFESAEELFGLE